VFVRFVVAEIDDDSQRALGIFQAIDKLRRRGILTYQEEQQEKAIGKWFDKNLAKPTRFTTSKRPHHNSSC
jgi:hypothetical protein